MGTRWTTQSIQWFLDASAYTQFHEKLAQVIAPYLDPADTLCDIGCGLGRLTMALSPYVATTTAIDINAQTIEHLESQCALRGISNLNPICGDVADHLSIHEVFLMSFFGRDGEMERTFPYCNKKVIRVVNASNSGNLYPDKYRKTSKSTIAFMETHLDTLGLSYIGKRFEFEFGQPLRSENEAIAFLRHHAHEASEKELYDFLEERALYTEDPSYPIYIPNKKGIGVFIIDPSTSTED